MTSKAACSLILVILATPPAEAPVITLLALPAAGDAGASPWLNPALFQFVTASRADLFTK